MPLLTRRRVLAAKIEGTPGTAESLSASDGVFNARNIRIQPVIGYEDREGQGALSLIAGVPGARAGRVTFELDVIGGATAPAWASTFLPACGLDEATGTPNTYTVDSRPVGASGSGQHLLTIGVFEDGNRKRIHGAMGTCEFICTPGQVMVARFTFMGVWTENPAADAMIAPTYPTTTPPRLASAGLTIGSFTPRFSEGVLDLGNNVVMREDPATAQGLFGACIVSRRPTWRMNPEATLVSTHGAGTNIPYADWVASTERALAFSIGTAGNRIAVAAPKLQIAEVSEEDRNGLLVDQTLYVLKRSAAAGDDELIVSLD